ncbi:hypothetical protein EGJ27_01605 [Pseudomonas sp. v388]|uniref:hypothetical protein n=1 Tax=Pseudomonas sp. v388 TaxID=2479849 RepID=UPI000F766EF9|nr:hypothetical protein [Pseudomonas sp. v388]RRV10345.1 hypothetical protein EGJ27_01605 [Pseudomonas sp. v388]
MNHERSNPTEPQSSPKAGAVDQSGKPVNVVRKDIEHEHSSTEGVDKVITPTSIKEKEQDAQAIREKSAQAERKLADRD